MRLDQPYRAEIGPYVILLPGTADLSLKIVRTPQAPGNYQMANTHWLITIGRFDISVHLDAEEDLSGLKRFIDDQTQGDVVTPAIEINSIRGVTYGGYGPARTWIDWWLKKGETMICLCLQSVEFPTTVPTANEVLEHNAIISSIKFQADHPDERPPIST